MTIRATKFTPEVLLSAPRRSAGSPNSDGTKILYSVSTYSFSEQEKTTEIRILDVKTQQSSLVTKEDGASEPNWLDDETIILFASGKEGATALKIGKADDFEKSSYVAGTVDGPAGNLKIQSLDDGTFVIAFSATATPDGELYNPEKAKKPRSSGRHYKSLMVRHWDKYVTENRNSVWTSKLSLGESDKYELGAIMNVLKGTRHESPIPPFGAADHFDLSTTGIIYTAKDPVLNPALHTKTNIYLAHPGTSNPPIQVNIPGFAGASTSTVFSHDGERAAFLSMRQDGYEADKNQIFIIPDVKRPDWVVHVFATEDGQGAWDRSPQSITWSKDGKSLYLVAEDKGRFNLYHLSLHDFPKFNLPELVLRGGTISDVQRLANDDLFVSSSNLIDNSMYMIYSTSTGTATVISSQSKEGSTFGLSRKQVDEINWEGAAKNTQVHAWVVKPSTFDEREKYPLAYLIHGGPQSAWADGWSTRWNPAVLAEQGYVVIAPNPTGSTGYGQAFTDAIQDNWGGLPYEDLVLGFDWIKENLSYVDTDRAVGLGASYGGYMINWIQGHAFGRRFRALVTHDGVFSMHGQLASEELYFPFHDLNGPLWSSPSVWSKWDPSNFTQHWSTPHLIIHSEKDYRLTIAEGLAPFNVLQARGVESEFLMFPDENHWVLDPENSLMWHRVVLDFVNRHVGLPTYSETEKKLEK